EGGEGAGAAGTRAGAGRVAARMMQEHDAGLVIGDEPELSERLPQRRGVVFRGREETGQGIDDEQIKEAIVVHLEEVADEEPTTARSGTGVDRSAEVDVGPKVEPLLTADPYERILFRDDDGRAGANGFAQQLAAPAAALQQHGHQGGLARLGRTGQK